MKAFSEETPNLFSYCALPWDKSYQDHACWPLVGLGGVGLPSQLDSYYEQNVISIQR